MEKETWRDLEDWADKEAKQFSIGVLKEQGYDAEYIVKSLNITTEQYIELSKDLIDK